MYYFLIPIYNEEANLVALYESIKYLFPDKSIFYVFVDDGSTDNSIGTLKAVIEPGNSIILGDGLNYGPGHAFNAGFEWILLNSKNPQDKIITLEADNTSDLSILPIMLTLSELNYNLVLASVYSQGGGFDKTSFIRKLLSAVANIVLRSIFNIKVQTLSSFYRVYHISLIRSIQEQHSNIIRESGFLCMIEILLKAIHANASIIEVPMVLKSEKRKGKSKMKIMRTMIQYLIFMLKTLIRSN